MQTGCTTSPPIQEMSDARQSVEAAESVGAEKLAPDALVSAQQLLSKAQNDLEAGQYEEAQKGALAAREAARQAVVISQAKQVVKQEQHEVTEKPKEPAVNPIPPTPSEPAPIIYTVATWDNLWSIAAKTSVYGDPLLWPLILKANANLIHNADLIFPGQVFVIDAGPSESNKQAAREHATHRGNTSRKEKDTSYLHQYGLR